jgi:hypothetical protein
MEMKKELANNIYDVFNDLLEFLDNYSDVIDGPGGEQRPNEAMRLMTRIEELMGLLDY